jgi:putative ABC transport system permease protein
MLFESWEGVRIALGSIRANPLRSALTTLGIIIGVVTVTLMGTAIDGLNRSFRQSISIIGADVLFVQRFSWMNHTHADWLRMRNRPPITLAQARAVEKEMTLARSIAPVVTTHRSVHYRDRRSNGVNVVGTTEQFSVTSGMGVAQGRFLTGAEVAGGRPVCVLGAEVATNLFERGSPIGSRIRIDHYSFEVVGVLERQGNFLGEFSIDNQIIVPVQQFIASFWSFPDFQIQVKALSLDTVEETKEELRGVLRKIRRLEPGDEDDFSINQQEAILETFYRVAGTIASVGFFITGLSLFVGGIGIMNIMFVSVAERTREIGIRKAIGAKRRAILMQFLLEAAGICLAGGLVALIIAYPLTLVMKHFFPATLSPLVVGLAILVSLLTGLISGFLPAWRAARLDPVEALRHE